MSDIKPILSTLVAGALLFGAPSLRADEGHDPAQHAHAKEATQAGAPMSSHDGMTALYKHLGEIEKERRPTPITENNRVRYFTPAEP